jgi:membrane protease subunit HflC
VITEPGLHFKLPDPIERKVKFDSRMMILEVPSDETTTKGAVPIIVNTYVVWRIADALQFYNSAGAVSSAVDFLRSQTRDTQNTVIGRHDLSEFVNSDPNMIQFETIQSEMLADLQQAVDDSDYGIKIEAVGLRQLKVSADVTKQVFERMRTERNSETQKIISEGESIATKIRADAEGKRIELLAAAEARANAIRARADAEAAEYYKLMDDDPEFAMFLRKIDAIKKILGKRSTYVVPPDVEPFDLLKEVPNIRPKQSGESK